MWSITSNHIQYLQSQTAAGENWMELSLCASTSFTGYHKTEETKRDAVWGYFCSSKIENVTDFSFNTKVSAPLHWWSDQISRGLLNTCRKANKAWLNGVFQKGSQVTNQPCSQNAVDALIFLWGDFSLPISQGIQIFSQTMNQHWAWFSLTTACIELLIDICIKAKSLPCLSQAPVFINTCCGPAFPSMERMDALITCVIWSLSSEWDISEGERGVRFIDFSKVRVGESGEKVLAQHNGLLFCWVSQYRRLSCRPRETLLIWLYAVRGGEPPTPCFVFFCNPMFFDLILSRCSNTRSTQRTVHQSQCKRISLWPSEFICPINSFPSDSSLRQPFIGVLYELFPCR